MICPGCGKDLPDNKRYCGYCGVDVKPEEKDNLCPNCSSSVIPGIKFCPKCGASLNAALSSAIPLRAPVLSEQPAAESPIKLTEFLEKEAAFQDNPQNTRGKSKIPLIVISAFALLLIAAGVLGSYYVSQNGWKNVPFVEKLVFLPFVNMESDDSGVESDAGVEREAVREVADETEGSTVDSDEAAENPEESLSSTAASSGVSRAPSESESAPASSLSPGGTQAAEDFLLDEDRVIADISEALSEYYTSYLTAINLQDTNELRRLSPEHARKLEERIFGINSDYLFELDQIIIDADTFDGETGVEFMKISFYAAFQFSSRNRTGSANLTHGANIQFVEMELDPSLMEWYVRSAEIQQGIEIGSNQIVLS